jgi:hypothetical protein
MNHPILRRADCFLTISLVNRSHVCCFLGVLVAWKSKPLLRKRRGYHESQQGAVVVMLMVNSVDEE